MNNLAPITYIERHSHLSTSELVVLTQNDNEAAFNALLKRYKRFIGNRVYRLAPDWSDHSDLIQEVNIRIWRFIKQLRQPQSFTTWLSQLILHVFYDELRKRPREFEFVSLDEPIWNDNMDESAREIGDNSRLPDNQLLAKELYLVVNEAISAITDQFRTAEILRDIEGLSYEEIARVTHCELGTVKSRIARARKCIQKRISEYLRECA